MFNETMSTLYQYCKRVLVNPLTQWAYLHCWRINFIKDLKALNISSMFEYMKGGAHIAPVVK